MEGEVVVSEGWGEGRDGRGVRGRDVSGGWGGGEKLA